MLRDQRGVTIVLVAILMVVLLGIAALAIDLSNLYVVRNEVQNAADAGALAGARVLYNDNGSAVNPGANLTAKQAATANKALSTTGATYVEVDWESGNTGDVQRGHWSFATQTFTPNDSLAMVDLWNVSDEWLDNPNSGFINAVRVVARREAPAAASFFAQIFGYQDFKLSKEAVAYRGFAGKIEPADVDQPIAICKESLLDSGGLYTCGYGRMIHSGSGTGHQTGGWTNFSQEPCETASTPTVRPLVCAGGNPDPIIFGKEMGTTGGEVEAAMKDFYNCWRTWPGLDTNADGWPDQPWPLSLPVIECPGNNTGNCSKVVGVVTLNVLWITRQDKETYKEVPRKMSVTQDGNMTIHECPEPIPGEQCWSEFVTKYNLVDVLNDLEPVEYQNQSIYFLPDCNYHEPVGTTGGNNYGVLAQIPVLVK